MLGGNKHTCTIPLVYLAHLPVLSTAYLPVLRTAYLPVWSTVYLPVLSTAHLPVHSTAYLTVLSMHALARAHSRSRKRTVMSAAKRISKSPMMPKVLSYRMTDVERTAHMYLCVGR